MIRVVALLLCLWLPAGDLVSPVRAMRQAVCFNGQV